MTDKVVDVPKENQNDNISLLKEFQSLREEITQLKQQLNPEKTAIEQRIDALVAHKIEQFKESEAKRIEDAKRTIEEAEANARIERELETNTKYRVHSEWIKNKEEEFK